MKILVNGFGTIGKRVAWAITRQDDMSLYGIVKTKPDYAALVAIKNGIDIYVPSEESLRLFEEKNVPVKGLLTEALEKVDLVVDATPAKIGAKYKDLYKQYGVKAIFQGGEKANVAEVSFNSYCNYEQALGKNYVRVVSCNTTGLLRLLCTLDKAVGVEKVRALLVRRAADPKEIKKGPINAIVLDPPNPPSHHGEDVKTVVPNLDILTYAVVVPTTLMHMHYLVITLKDYASRAKIISALEDASRILLVDSSRLSLKSTAELVELARDLGRPRNDFYELLVWENSITVNGRELMLVQSVHQEAIVVPENIDAIRAMLKLVEDPLEAINKTDKSLGITGRLIN